MPELEYKRLILKNSTGAPTVPVTASHDDGTWVDTDLYPNELYVDVDTGLLYLNVGGSIVQVTAPSPGLDAGRLIAALTSSGNADQQLTKSVVEIAFDTDDVAAYGTIARAGNKFEISAGGAGLYLFELQPQVTEASPSNITTMWAVLNGTAVPNSAVRNSSSGTNETYVNPLIVSMDLVDGDVVSFSTITTIANGCKLDYTAAVGPAPATPAVILDVKGWKK
jgi:hypothetical protein